MTKSVVMIVEFDDGSIDVDILDKTDWHDQFTDLIFAHQAGLVTNLWGCLGTAFEITKVGLT